MELMGRGFAWLDTGTHDSLLDAAIFIRLHRGAPGTEDRAARRRSPVAWGISMPISCNDWPDPLRKNGYGRYLLDLLETASAS